MDLYQKSYSKKSVKNHKIRTYLKVKKWFVSNPYYLGKYSWVF